MLYCIDAGQKITLKGAKRNFARQFFSFGVKPCQPTSNKSCNYTNVADIENSLGVPEIVILSNEQRFDQNAYSKNPIVNDALLTRYRFTVGKP